MGPPNTISSLTEVLASDPFNRSADTTSTNINRIVDGIRSNITESDSISFNNGLNFYKRETQTGQNVLNIFNAFYCDLISSKIKVNPDIPDAMKPIIIKMIDENTKCLCNSANTIGELLAILSKERNMLDARQIAYIMLGYATGTIKKIHST